MAQRMQSMMVLNYWPSMFRKTSKQFLAMDWINRKKYSRCSGKEEKSWVIIGRVSLRITGTICRNRPNMLPWNFSRQEEINRIISGSLIKRGSY